jgi:hypothetical protein
MRGADGRSRWSRTDGTGTWNRGMEGKLSTRVLDSGRSSSYAPRNPLEGNAMKRAGAVVVLLFSASMPVAAQDAADGAVASGPPAPAAIPGRKTVGAPFPTRIVFTNIAGHATAQVPGLPGVEFQPGNVTTAFDRPFGGAQGGNWIIAAQTNQAATLNEIVLRNETTVLHEGDPAPWAAGQTIGTIDTRVSINDSGDWAFATNTEGGPTTSDEAIVRVIGGVGGTFIPIAVEGQPVTGLPTATWGATLESVTITPGSDIALVADGLGGTPAGQNEILWLASGPFATTGVIAPTGQLGTESWENFGTEDYWVAPSGTWLVQGDLSGPTATDGVVAVMNEVKVQEGVVLAGSGFAEPVSTIAGSHLDPANHWLIRGSNATSALDWVYRDGVVVAATDQPIHTGATELWDDTDFAACFFLQVGNARGDFVIGGVTNAPTATNGVLVLNDERVIVREGDPVDLNGNGLPDDDLFFNTFGNDDGQLSRTGFFRFTATLRNGAGTAIAQGLFELDLTEYVPVELVGFSVS